MPCRTSCWLDKRTRLQGCSLLLRPQMMACVVGRGAMHAAGEMLQAVADVRFIAAATQSARLLLRFVRFRRSAAIASLRLRERKPGTRGNVQVGKAVRPFILSGKAVRPYILSGKGRRRTRRHRWFVNNPRNRWLEPVAHYFVCVPRYVFQSSSTTSASNSAVCSHGQYHSRYNL